MSANSDYQYLDEKYDEFFVSAYSKRKGKYRNIGKPHATIEAAIRACAYWQPHHKWFLHVDVAHD